MRRAIVAIAATGTGLALVLGFHPKSTPTTATTLPPATATGAVTTKGGLQTVTGTDQPIGGSNAYGDIQVRVSASNGKIVKVDLARLNVSGPSSQQIVKSVVPQLEQQTIAAQSVNINGVSGATYTVQAYKTSLQSALDQLATKGAVSAQAATNNGNSGFAGDHGDGGGEGD